MPKKLPAPDRARAAIEAYAAGISIQDIAAQHGVDRGTIYDWMLADLGGEQYQQLITRALVRRIADADHKLEAADEPHHIARAREMARFARMDLERRRPALYGQRSHIEHSGAITHTLHERLMRAEGRIIEHDAVATQDTPAIKSVTDQ